MLSTCPNLTALSIGGHIYDLFVAYPPLDFSALGNLNHLRISVSAFLANKSFFSTTPGVQSLTDDRMRQRFPDSLRKLVLMVYKNEEHLVLPALQHYIGAEEPSILPHLKEREVCCHAPEVIYVALHVATQRHNIHLRIFRKLQTDQESLYMVPFVNTVEGTSQEIFEVAIQIVPPVSKDLLEDLMPLEEYTPQKEIAVQVCEESRTHQAQL